jgi:hypothetical protein
MVGRYLADHYPTTIFPRPVRSLSRARHSSTPANSHYRLYPFIENSVSIDLAYTPQQAFEAARQFGGFTRMLADFPAERLHEDPPGLPRPVPALPLLQGSPAKPRPERIDKATPIIDYLQSQNRIVTTNTRASSPPPASNAA